MYLKHKHRERERKLMDSLYTEFRKVCTGNCRQILLNIDFRSDFINIKVELFIIDSHSDHTEEEKHDVFICTNPKCKYDKRNHCVFWREYYT